MPLQYQRVENIKRIIEKAKSYLNDTYETFCNAYNIEKVSWCVIYVWYVFKQAGLSSLFYDGEKIADCYSVRNWAKDNDLIVGNRSHTNTGMTGDLLLCTWHTEYDADHIAIILENNKEGGYYKVISGNDNDRVRKNNVYYSNVAYIIRPKYGGVTPVPVPDDGTVPGGGGGEYITVDGPVTEYKAIDYDGKQYPKIKSSRTNHKDGNISDLTKNIKIVDDYIRNGHDVTSYITFSVNNFSLDTRDPDSFKHYAISLENQKTGVGQGNQFKLKIAYHKHFSNYADINMLETALTPLRESSLYLKSGKETKKLSKNECILQYGYIVGGKSLESPKYVGLLLKYSVKANKQIVEYTLEGFTGEQICTNTVNWYPDVQDMESVETVNGNRIPVAVLALKEQNIRLSDEALRSYITKLNSEYEGGLTFQPFLTLDCFLRDYNSSLDDDSTKFILLDCTNGHRGKNLADARTLEPVHMSICKGQTPIQYIEYCISLFKYRDTDYSIQFLQQELQTSERFIYNLVRDPDDINTMYVCVDVIDDSDTENKVAYTFTGYATDNALLIDYDLNYDGTVALAVANMSEEENKNNAIFIDKDGTVRARTSITRDMFIASEISEVLISKQNTWLDRISCANNCTMTTFGLPFEITVGTIFKCGIYITDVKHHTSGNCFVTGITDRIENSMFTSTFTMIRLPGKNLDIEDNYG